MKKFTTFFAVALFSFSTAFAQVPANSNAIMLQGFYWDSNIRDGMSWTKLYEISGDISAYFDYVWLPPSAASEGGTGYHPVQLSNQTSAWGSETKLKQLINHLKSNGCKAIADIVANHRGNMSTWCDFYPDNFGDSYGSWQFTTKHIVGNDPMWTNPEAETSCRNTPADQRGANKPNQYEMYGAARNLDHSSEYVQNATKAYLKFLKTEIGYDGWRYDVAKGFSPGYFGEYSDVEIAGSKISEISIGEYMDGSYDALDAWITGTGNKSMIFDFAFKFKALAGLQGGVYGTGEYAMTWTDGGVKRPAGLIHHSNRRKYAVTFIDNHDTYCNRDENGSRNTCDRDHIHHNEYTGDILKAHAFMLSSPGIPCVFYPHWADANYRTIIQNMMKARKAVGLHSNSVVQVQNPYGDVCYKAYSEGTCGAMLTYIGNITGTVANDEPYLQADGWDVANKISGNGWAIYTKITDTNCGTAYQNKINAGINPDPDPTFTSITLTAIVPATWTAPKIHVWNANDNNENTNRITSAKWPGDAMTKVTGNKFSITLSGFPATGEVGVVINNGAAAPNTQQTIDLFATRNTCWEIDNAPTGAKYGATKREDCVLNSINEIEANKFSIYPNPVNDELKIMNYEFKGNEMVQILDIAGKIILNTQYSVLNTNSIDVSSLAKGIYFVKVGNQVEKFIKK